MNFLDKFKTLPNYRNHVLNSLNQYLQTRTTYKAKAINSFLNGSWYLYSKLYKKNLSSAQSVTGHQTLTEAKDRSFSYKKHYVSPATWDLERAKRIIDDKRIKVVSFDIFDTLLVRPVLSPSDLFYLVAAIVDAKYGIDFVKLRLHAEKSPNETLDSIYRNIKKQEPTLSNEILEDVKNIELRVESQLLFPRKEVKKLYEYACMKGKRIIAVSDMYLSSNWLQKCLKNKGFEDIARVYVSNEFKARKDSGELFELVLEKEQLESTEIFHIGDNLHSDFEVAQSKGIPAFYYASVVSCLFDNETLWKDLKNTQDPMIRIMMGFLLNKYSEKILNRSQTNGAMFANCYELGMFGISPIVMLITLWTLNHSVIQKQYKEIYYAGRDGYLPQKAYSYLRKYVQRAIPSNYFEAGRVLYFPLYKPTFEDFIKVDESVNKSVSLQRYLTGVITDQTVLNEMLSQLSDEERKTLVHRKQEMLRCCTKIRPLIESYLKNSKKNLKTYYSTIFRESCNIVFDLGYSGSISCALGKIDGNKTFDKLYVWATEQSFKRDKLNGTKTFSIFGDLNQRCQDQLHLVLEEVFSPLNARPRFVDESGLIQYFDEQPSEEMIQDMTALQDGVLNVVKEFGDHFRDLISYFSFTNVQEVFHPLRISLFTSPYSEVSLMKNIVFEDFAQRDSLSLTQKVEMGEVFNRNPLLGTGLVNPADYLHDKKELLVETNIRLGVHLHIYNESLIWEATKYLENLPDGTDIYITSPKRDKVKLIELVAQANCVGKNVKVISTPNRGRDVGSWLISVKAYQDQYDLFCHLHCKQSWWMPQSADWRHYLFDNLMSTEALNYTIKAFEEHKELGVLSPQPYDPIVQVYDGGVAVVGENHEIMKDLYRRIYCSNMHMIRDDLSFSVGTMFWYRPDALKALFNAGLSFENFPEEPIGIDGTMAHAVERMIKIVCEKSKYEFKYMAKNFHRTE